MNNEIDCEHLFPKKVDDYIFGDAYKTCLKCGDSVNVCQYERLRPFGVHCVQRN